MKTTIELPGALPEDAKRAATEDEGLAPEEAARDHREQAGD